MKLKLLIIEDAGSDVELIVRYLHKAGFEVAYRQADSLTALQDALSETWDFVISDYNLPGLSGELCLDTVRSRYPLVPFVLISGAVGEEVAVQMMRRGASDYIMKDNLTRLSTVIDKELTAANERKRRKLLDNAILTVSQAVISAGVDDFFEKMLSGISTALKADEAMVCLTSNIWPTKNRQTICRIKDEVIDQDLAFVLDHAPFLDKAIGDVVIYESGFKDSFPAVGYLQEMRYEAYVGVKLNGLNGQAIGVLAVLYRHTLEHADVVTQVLGIYAARIAAEMERNRAEYALRQSEQRFAGFFKNSPTAMSVANMRSGFFMDVNDSFCLLSGFTREELIGRTSAELNLYANPNDREWLFKHLKEYGKLESREFVYRTKSGRFVHCLTSIAIQQINGEDYLLATIQDITDKTEALRHQREAETKLTAYFNSTTEIIFLLDTRYKILAFNKMAEEAIQKYYGKQVLVGDSMLYYAEPSTIEEFKSEFQEAVKGKIIHKEVVIPISNAEVWWEVKYVPIRNIDGEINAVSFTSINIDKRKKADLELQQNEERFRAMVNNISDIITLLDAEGRIVYQSASVKKVLGYEETDLIGDVVFTLLHPDDVAATAATFMSFLETKGTGPIVEFRMLHKEGHYVYMEAQGSYQLDNPVINAIVVVSRDVSDRKKAEGELIKQSKHLAASNAELERFAYVASHDLQEPLRMVSSFVTLLEKKYRHSLDETGKKYIDFAVEGAGRMRQLILDLLMYSKLGSEETVWHSIDLNELLDETLQILQVQIKHCDAIINRGVLPTIIGDKIKLQQLFQNLIANAIKYQPQNHQPVIHINAIVQEGACHVSIADNGIGINPRYFDKIFVVFQRLHNKDEYSGTGIGLSICKKIIDSIGGKIWVDSQEGKGSIFHFSIPQNAVVPPLDEDKNFQTNTL